MGRLLKGRPRDPVANDSVHEKTAGLAKQCAWRRREIEVEVIVESEGSIDP